MTSYPDSIKVQQGQGTIVDIPESEWHLFCDVKDANSVKSWVENIPGNQTEITVVHSIPEGTLVYEDYNTTIRCYMIEGYCNDSSGSMFFSEYMGDLYDRSFVPDPEIDEYTVPTGPGGIVGIVPSRVLKCRRISPSLGQLYWEKFEDQALRAKAQELQQQQVEYPKMTWPPVQ